MTTSKKLTSKNGITIPKHLRLEAGFMPGMAVDIETTAEGVLVRKHVPVCRFCGEVHKVQTVSGMDICADCAGNLKKELEEKHGV